MKKQLDTELEHLTTSFAQLRAAQAKFKECVLNTAKISEGRGAKTPGMLNRNQRRSARRRWVEMQNEGMLSSVRSKGYSEILSVELIAQGAQYKTVMWRRLKIRRRRKLGKNGQGVEVEKSVKEEGVSGLSSEECCDKR